MKHLETMISMVFGGIFMVLSLMVAAETLLRKLFGVSDTLDPRFGACLAALARARAD